MRPAPSFDILFPAPCYDFIFPLPFYQTISFFAFDAFSREKFLAIRLFFAVSRLFASRPLP
jgi:hypothetical protein